MPARLSGGQAHRVALGRLLLAHCDALLLDEPYTGLDASLRRALTELVVRLVAARDVPAVLVAHELADAQAFADRLAVLDRGRLLQVGAPDEVVLRPASRRVAELVGYLGFVPVQRGPAAGWRRGGRHGRNPSGAGRGRGSARPRRGADRGRDGVPPGRGGLGGGPARGRDGDHLPAAGPAAAGGQLVVTALDPPCFGPDGAAVQAEPSRPEQVRG